MTTTYKGFKIDHKEGAAVVYKDETFIKGFASAYPPIKGKMAIDKAKKFIDNQD